MKKRTGYDLCQPGQAGLLIDDAQKHIRVIADSSGKSRGNRFGQNGFGDGPEALIEHQNGGFSEKSDDNRHQAYLLQP